MRRLALFTKPPIAGRVKTRLQTELSAEQAAALHRAFLLDLLEQLPTGAFSTTLLWALDPGAEPPELAPARGLEWAPQSGGDLGERMVRGLGALAGSAASVAAIGSDLPELTNATIEQAFARLETGDDVVIGPSLDGGYYLIALRRPRPEIFREIAWSTERVLEQTLERCASAGLRVSQLAPARDIDHPDDLRALAGRLQGTMRCPHTRRALAALGWLEEGR